LQVGAAGLGQGALRYPAGLVDGIDELFDPTVVFALVIFDVDVIFTPTGLVV
jgi:hypothetical protein